MTLHRIANVTRIPIRSLEHLEAGAFEELPADVFVRGFLRSYARCVGLDVEDTIRRYAECGMTPAPVASPMAEELAESMARLDASGPSHRRQRARTHSGTSRRAQTRAQTRAHTRAHTRETTHSGVRRRAQTNLDEPNLDSQGDRDARLQRDRAPSESGQNLALETRPDVTPGAAPAVAPEITPAANIDASPDVSPPDVAPPDKPPDDKAPDGPATARAATAGPGEESTEIDEIRDIRDAQSGEHTGPAGEPDDDREDPTWRNFLPPSLLDTETGTRRGALTLAVIILVIVATLTMSYLLRRPNSAGDGVTNHPATPSDTLETIATAAGSLSSARSAHAAQR